MADRAWLIALSAFLVSSIAMLKPDELLFRTALATDVYHVLASPRPASSLAWLAASACGGLIGCTRAALEPYSRASPSAACCWPLGSPLASSRRFAASTWGLSGRITLSTAVM